MAPSKDSRALPPKEEALFRQVLQQYEAKNFKKAIKTADQILKKYPGNGQTVSMKALVLFHSPANPELKVTVADNERDGLALAKEGVRKDAESQLCWHILGMLHRAKKEYALAAKSFGQALKADPYSQQILRDSAQVSLHLRQHQTHLANRLVLFQLRPNERKSWLSLALAYELAGDLANAERVLGGLIGEVQRVPSEGRVEEGEIREWRVRVLCKAGLWKEALEALDVGLREDEIINREEAGVLRAEILRNLGRKDEAEDAYRTLLERNSDNQQFYIDFLLNRGLDIRNLTDESRPKVLRALENFAGLYPRAGAPVRLALSIAQGDDFKDLVRQYVSRGLERGVPSLFADLKAYYGEEGKRAVVEAVVEELKSTLESTGTLDGSTDHAQPPTTLLWTYYFLSLHYSHPSPANPTPDPARALSYLEAALAHTPTLPELYTARARVLKHSGDALGAARAMDDARALDGQDRFLNSKSGKYWLRAGEPERAQAILGLFTKKDAPSPAADLVDMQCFWFVTEDAACWERKGRLGMALKRYSQLFKMFEDLEDDQFDFHGYCIRKSTFKAYLKLIEFEDDLRSRPTYVRAALAAAAIYVQLADDSTLAGRAAELESSSGGVSAEEAKKAAQKAKKAALKLAADAAKKAGADKKAAPAAVVEAPPPKDEDPAGLELLKTTAPLDEAAKLLAPLQTSPGVAGRIDVWLAIYRVAIRRGKFLQAVQALSRASAIDSTNAELLFELVHFKKTAETAKELPEPTAAIISSVLKTLLPSSVDLSAFVKEALAAQSQSPAHVLAAAQALLLIAPESLQNDVEPLLFTLLNPSAVATTSVATALDALRLLESAKSSRVAEFRDQAKARWTVARVFDTAEESQARREQFLADEKALKEAQATVDGQ